MSSQFEEGGLSPAYGSSEPVAGGVPVNLYIASIAQAGNRGLRSDRRPSSPDPLALLFNPALATVSGPIASSLAEVASYLRGVRQIYNRSDQYDLLLCKLGVKESDRAHIAVAHKICDVSHKGEFRISGEPYADHPEAGSLILGVAGYRERDVHEVELLHDVLENSERLVPKFVYSTENGRIKLDAEGVPERVLGPDKEPIPIPYYERCNIARDILTGKQPDLYTGEFYDFSINVARGVISMTKIQASEIEAIRPGRFFGLEKGSEEYDKMAAAEAKKFNMFQFEGGEPLAMIGKLGDTAHNLLTVDSFLAAKGPGKCLEQLCEMRDDVIPSIERGLSRHRYESRSENHHLLFPRADKLLAVIKPLINTQIKHYSELVQA